MTRQTEKSRLNPTLFDKLVGDTDISGMRGDEMRNIEANREAMRYYSVPKLERFNERALRATIRRELSWLLNTTNFESRVNLDRYPHVKTSVLNYGVPDMSGQNLTRRLIQRRARDLRNAVRAFEPRIDESTLFVQEKGFDSFESGVSFVIQGDVTSAVKSIPVKFRTEFDFESGAASVTE